MNYTFFALLRATSAWLALPRERRRALADETLGPILRPLEGKLRMRFFDAEAFTALCSDILMTETTDLQHHYFFMEGLRDSPLMTHPFFEVVHIIPTIEEGYKTYEAATAQQP